MLNHLIIIWLWYICALKAQNLVVSLSTQNIVEHWPVWINKSIYFNKMKMLSFHHLLNFVSMSGCSPLPEAARQNAVEMIWYNNLPLWITGIQGGWIFLGTISMYINLKSVPFVPNVVTNTPCVSGMWWIHHVKMEIGQIHRTFIF